MKKQLTLICSILVLGQVHAQLIPFSFMNKSSSTGFVATNFSSSGPYTIPVTGCTNLVVKVWGGGGGAGGGYLGHLGLNGGRGDYRTSTLSVTPSEIINIHIGLGGKGGPNSSGVTSPGGTTTGQGQGGAGSSSLNSGVAAGGGGAASSIVNGGGTILVISGGGGGGAGGGVMSGTSPLNIGGSAPGGAGVNDNFTYESCVTYSASPPSCPPNRIAASGANGTIGSTGVTGGGGGGGGGGLAGGTGGMGGTYYGPPYRSGGGNAGTSSGGTSSVNTTHGAGGVGHAHDPGTDGADGYISLVSCT